MSWTEARPASLPPKRFLVIPWIRQRGDALLDQVRRRCGVEYAPVALHDIHDNDERHFLLKHAHRDPRSFAQFFERRLLQVEAPVNALLLTHDWPSPMRLAEQVAKAHGLKTMVLTHEGFFADKARYYVDKRSGRNIPEADVTFVWGRLQRDIFLERGASAEAIRMVGSPLLHDLKNHVPSADRASFRAALGVGMRTPLITYVVQPLDNIADTPRARALQIEAIGELAQVCAEEGWAFVVRMPPGQRESDLFALFHTTWGERPPFPLVHGDVDPLFQDALTQILHSEIVVGYSSTMLVQASLLDRASIIYNPRLPPSFIEDKIGLPICASPEDFRRVARAALSAGAGSTLSEQGRAWADWAYGRRSLAEDDPFAALREAFAEIPFPAVTLKGRAPLFSCGGLADWADADLRWRLAWRRLRRRLRGPSPQNLGARPPRLALSPLMAAGAGLEDSP